jgi:RNA polymerase sigma-54 factor
MTLLALSNTELEEKVLKELGDNPALELLEERVCPNCSRRLPPVGSCPNCSTQSNGDDPIVFLSPRDSYRPSRRIPPEDLPPDQDLVAPEDLVTHLLQQLAADLPAEDRHLAVYILYSLDEDGFLTDPPAVIARSTRSSLFQVMRIIDLISHADPPGLATSGPQQALMAQLDLMDQELPLTSLARAIIKEAFSELGHHKYDRIATRLQISEDKVRKAASYIQDNLNPFPARSFWGSGRQAPSPEPTVYHTPDIQITRSSSQDNSLRVEIFSPISGWLRVDPLFRKALSQTEGEPRNECQRYLDRASLFVKCLQQRDNTMRRMMKLLVSEQKQFILDGDRHLKPMTRARMARKLGVHESTISRAVSQKSVALPNGRIIPLARFFDRSLPIRDRVREIVAEETKPLTDEEIAAILEEDGVKVARRTVAKYRAIEGILPARLRHRSKKQQKVKV